MIRRKWFKGLLCGLVLPVLTVGLLSAEEKGQNNLKQRIVIRKEIRGQESGYWIGVELEPLSPVVKSQLNLENGFVAQQVVPDSPAAKAGIKQHDILLRFGDHELKNIDDLAAAVGKSKGKQMAVTLLRGGKKQTLQVTPAQRPEEQAFQFNQPKAVPFPGQPPRDPKDLEKWIEQFLKSRVGEGPGRMFFMRPGVVIRNDLGKRPEFPKNTTITVEKQDDKPAKVIVKKDGKTYETTADKLDKLPEDVRDYVKQFLGNDKAGKGAFGFGAGQFNIPNFGPGAPHVQARIKIAPAPGQPNIAVPVQPFGAPADLQKQLDEVLKRLEKLQKQVDKIEKDD